MLSPQERAAALQRAGRDLLPLGTLGMAAMALESLISHWLRLEPPQRDPLVYTALATLIFMLAFWAAQRVWAVPLKWVHPAILLGSLVMLGNILALLQVVGEVTHNLYLCLMLGGVAMFFSSTAWFLAVAALTLAGWAWQAWVHRGDPAWIESAYFVGEGLVLAAIVHRVRRRSILAMESLRLREEKRAADLETAVEGLRASEELFRQFAENCGQVLWINKLDTSEVTYVNRVYEELTGRPIQNLYDNPMDWTSAIHQEDRRRVQTAYQTFRQTGRFDENYRVLRPDGGVRWVHDRAFLLAPSTGGVSRIAGIVQDITDRVLTERQLRESERTNRAILAALPDMIMRMKADGTIISIQVAREFSPMWPVDGAHLREMQPPQVTDRFIVAAHDALATQRLQTLEYEGVRDGRRQWREARFTPAGNDEVLVVIRDFTARKQAEQELLVSRHQLSELIGDIDGMVWECDPNTFEFSFVSPRAEAMLGYPVAKWLSDPTLFAAILHPDDRDRAVSYCRQRTLDGANHELTYRMIAADGRIVWIHDKVHPVKDAAGVVVRLRGIMFDITALKESEIQRHRLEDDLRQSQKLEAIGTLASGVAHDFNNLLTAIGCATELAVQELAPEHPARQSLATVTQAVDQATGVTRSLLTFAHHTPYRKTATDLTANLHDALGLLRRLLPARVEVIEDFPADLRAFVLADAHQLQQVWMNLAINARDAMPQGGKLRFRVRRAVELPRDPAGSWGGRTDQMLAVQVIDEGVGMDEATLARIFEPYFTTKPRGQGTGLGLAIVHGIVTDHHGKLRVRSAPGRGTCFTLLLPTCAAPLPVREATIAAAPVGEVTVLLAEVSEYVRAIMASSLRAAGYDVITANDGNEVVRLFQEERARIRAVVLGLDLPGRSGEACLALIRQVSPQLPVVIVAGDPGQELAAGEIVIGKPFQVTQLVAAVNAAIAVRQTEPIADAGKEEASP